VSLNNCRNSLLIVLCESRDDLAESRLFRLSELEEFNAERAFPDSLHRGLVDHERPVKVRHINAELHGEVWLDRGVARRSMGLVVTAATSLPILF
jgi:hypothetical protein